MAWESRYTSRDHYRTWVTLIFLIGPRDASSNPLLIVSKLTMDTQGILCWLRNVQVHEPAYCRCTTFHPASPTGKYYRNTSSILLKPLPPLRIQALIPSLLVEQLGVRGTLAILPYTSKNRLVSAFSGLLLPKTDRPLVGSPNGSFRSHWR